MFTLPNDFVSSALANVGDLFEAVKQPVILIFGIALGMWLINYILGLVGRRAKSRRGAY